MISHRIIDLISQETGETSRFECLKSRVLLVFLLCLFSPAALCWQDAEPLNLSSEQSAWLREHPVVTVGVYAGNLAPVESWRGGKPEGLGVDYLRLLASRVGLQLEFHPYSDLQGVVSGPQPPPFDVLPAQPITPERSSRFLMMRPFAQGAPVMIAREGDQRIRNAADLQQARIAVERRFTEHIQHIRQRFPNSALIYVGETGQALDMVVRGEADAYIALGPLRARALINQRPMHDLSFLGPVGLPSQAIAPAVRHDLPMLASILRAAEATVTEMELSQLRMRWGENPGTQTSGELMGRLTPQEARDLQHLPVLRVGYEVDRYPYSFANGKGEFDGLAADYVRLVQQRLGLRIELVPADDWSHLQRMVRAHEIDMIVAGTLDDFGPEDMRFSQPYEYFPEVIVSRLHGPSFAGPRDLAGRSIAVRTETGLLERLRTLMPSSKIIPVESNEAGLAMVEQENADAFIGTLPPIDALIRTRYAGELRVVGPAGLDQELSFGVLSQYSELLPLIDRVLMGIGEGEKQRIRSQWLTAEYRYGVSWVWVVGIAALALLIVGVFSFAYARLKRASDAKSRAEKQLASQLAFQQALLETIPYPVFVKDAQGCYLAVNRAYEDLTGISRQRLLGKTLKETHHLHGRDSGALHDEEFELLAAGSESRRELRLEDADGRERHLFLWLHPFASEDSQGNGLLGTLVDVTEIREAEARARASEQRLSDITAALPMTVFQFRIGSDGIRKFTYVAGDVQGMLAISAEQLLADEPSLFNRVHPEDRRPLLTRLAAVERGLQPLAPFDFRIRVDDKWRWLRTEGGQPRRLEDGSAAWSGYWIDTSAAHVQAEALTEAKAQAESAASTKAAFLAAMSHEIRTPMAGVLGLIELLSRTPMDQDQTQMLGMADDSAKAMLQILDDILDYSRIESGRLNIAHAPFDPRYLVDSVAGLFSAKAREKNLRLYAIQDWHVASLLMGDTVRLRQILTNLMSNAVKFTEEGSVTLTMEVCGDGARSQRLRFVITDTGIGISEEDLQRLFQPFTQAEQSASRRYGGTGLGLTISRRLATMMGGQLRLEGEPDKGARAIFEITLEVAEEAHALPIFEGKQAWLQCSDPLRNAELSHALSAIGFSVLEGEPLASDGARIALRIIDQIPPEPPSDGIPVIIIRDVYSGMPHADDYISIDTNPVRWHAVVDACRLALGRQAPQIFPTTTTPVPRLKEHVLVAEDHPTNRAVIARQLESLGYTYSLVADGEQALRALAAVDFDLLITDCHMPVLDGYAVARQIRLHEGRNKHLPIIAMSASALPEQVQRCLDAGMDDFLAKPVQLADLARKLDIHLHTGPTFSSAKAAESEEKPTPQSGPSNALEYLEQVLGNQSAAVNMLSQLVSTTRADLRELEQLPGDAKGQRHSLLHRMEGALSLVQTDSAANGALYPEHLSSQEREQLIRNKLLQLETLFRDPI